MLACGLFAGVLAITQAAEQKFFSDDPLTREPETQDASGAQPWDINLFYDLSYNLFVTPGREPANVRAQNVNTIDEVPDSSWFTNRIGARALTLEELVRGPIVGPPPVAAKWTITREKSAGARPASPPRTRTAQTFFVSFDSPSNPEGATGAVVIATKIFWALGYNQVEYFLTEMRRDAIEIAPNATTRRPSGDRTPLTDNDVSEILERAAPSSRRLVPHRRRPSAAGEDTRRLQVPRARGPTIPTTSFPISIGASCERCASSGPGPTSPT